MSNEHILWRLCRWSTVLLIAAATVIVSAEWIARQSLQQNVLLDWIQVASALGFLCAAAALPFGQSLRSGGQTEDRKLALAKSVLVVLGVSILALNLCWYAFSAETQHVRLPYAGFLTLWFTSIVAAFAASLLLARSIRVMGSQPESIGQSGQITDRRLFVPCAAIAASSILGFMLLPVGDVGPSKLGQIVWSLWSQDDFLTLLIISCLIQASTATNFGLSDRSSDEMTVSQIDLVGNQSDFGGSAPEPAWSPVNCLVLFSTVILVSAIILGIRVADAVAAIFLPALVLFSIAWMFGLALLVGSSNSNVQKQSRFSEFSVRRTFAIRSLIATLIFFLPIALVLFGYARPVEIAALFGLLFVIFALVDGGRRQNFAILLKSLPGHIGALSICVLAAGFLYLTTGATGFQSWIADTLELSRLDLPVIVFILLCVSIVLSRWLAPLELFIVLLPFSPTAIQSSGASLEQTFVINFFLVLLGSMGYRFASTAHHEQKATQFGLFFLALVILFGVVIFPELAERVPAGRRFW